MKKEYIEKIVELMKESLKIDCIPVGAIVIRDGKIIGSGYNKKNNTNIISDHAEIVAINEACKNVNDWRLSDCELYVSLYPCMMCLGAIKESRIKRVYYFADKIEDEHDVNKNKLTECYAEKIEDYGDSEKQLKLFFENIRKNN